MTDVMILAAGLGTRMKSKRAKVLHELAGLPLAAHGEQAEKSGLPELRFVLQADQRGTGHAVIAAREQLAERQGDLVVLAGDAPLIKGETLKKLVDAHQAEKNDATMLTVVMDDPTGYGRIIRDEEGRLVGVVEQKDGSE